MGVPSVGSISGEEERDEEQTDTEDLGMGIGSASLAEVLNWNRGPRLDIPAGLRISGRNGTPKS